MNETVEQIAAYLLKDPFFLNFKLRKRDSCLIKKTDYGNQTLELQTWFDRNPSNGKNDVIVQPNYSVRFNILHKWFEKFSFKTTQDQRDNDTIGFQGCMLGEKDEYRFSKTNKILQHFKLKAFKKDIIKNSSFVFRNINSLNDFYKIAVQPVILNKKTAPDVGADWVFQYLLCTRIVDNREYEKAKSVILERVEELHNRGNGEPNIERYYDKLDEILFYLENEVVK